MFIVRIISGTILLELAGLFGWAAGNVIAQRPAPFASFILVAFIVLLAVGGGWLIRSGAREIGLWRRLLARSLQMAARGEAIDVAALGREVGVSPLRVGQLLEGSLPSAGPTGGSLPPPAAGSQRAPSLLENIDALEDFLVWPQTQSEAALRTSVARAIPPTAANESKLVYTVGAEDIKVWMTHGARTHGSYRQKRRLLAGLYFGTMWLAVIGAVGWTAVASVLGAVLGAGVAAWVFGFYPRSIGAIVARFYQKYPDPVVLGQQTMRLTSDGIVTEHAHSTTFLHWHGLLEITSFPHHTFVAVGPLRCLILPRHGVTHGDYVSFVAELEQRWNEGRRTNRGALSS